jgi:integrase
MGTPDRLFSLYPRKRKSGKSTYYCRFRRTDGSWAAGKSTGQTSVGAAEAWALEQIATGKVPATMVDCPTLAQWAAGFWDAGGRYDRARRARGYVLSPTYLNVCRLWTARYLIPPFGRRKLSELTAEVLEEHFLGMYEAGELSPRTINHIMTTFRAMLREAHRLGKIPANPMTRVSKFKERPRRRGVLALAELEALFGPGALEKVWKGARQPYLMALLAVSTGARHGELLSLRRRDVYPGYIDIARGFDRTTRTFKEPKWGSRRIVTLPARVEEELTAFMDDSPRQDPDALVFSTPEGKPVEVHDTLVVLYLALSEIGIDEAERRRRFLDMHALRHTFVSLFRGAVSDTRLRAATGHKSMVMLEHYTGAPTAADLEELREAQDRTFGAP